jgi:Clostripain family
MTRRATPFSSSSSTCLVYLAGDNNLSADMVWSLQEMRKATRDPRVREKLDLSVLFDPSGANPRRYDFVDKGEGGGNEDGRLAAVPSVEYPERTSPRQIFDRFLTERLLERPRAARSLVVLSGHGSGAAGDFLVDDDPGGALSIVSLGTILDCARVAMGSPIDVLGLDSCEMSGVEVAYELRRSTSYLIASEGLVLDAGWPYHRVVQSIVARPKDSPLDLAKEIARRYLAFYSDYELVGISTDLALTDLERIEPVADSVAALAKAMSAPLDGLAPDGIEEAIELGDLQRTGSDADGGPSRTRALRDAILLAHWSAQSYRGERYVDLVDFVEQLLRFSSGQTGPEIDAIRSSGGGVLDAVRAAVVLSGTTGARFQHSHGLSIYFPWSDVEDAPGYPRLSFSERTGWPRFLDVYFQATKRVRRDQRSHLQVVEAVRGVALDRGGRAVVPLPPRRRPRASFPAKDVESGTHKDVESGTHKGETCESTMKNPPDGYYERPPGDDSR